MNIASDFIKQIAQNNGFALCGIAKAEPLSIEQNRFEAALTQNFHAKKEYLERDIEKRFNPELLLKNCKSVVVCGFNYNTVRGKRCEVNGVRCEVSLYAKIKDYHIFMKEKLEVVAQNLKENYGDFNYKTTIDSSGISEKAWAVRAGIGYYGKNGIIQTSVGSFVFLGLLLMDIEVDEYDTPNLKTCGNCSKCMIECPTRAIVKPYYVDCNQCITFLNTNKNEDDFFKVAKYGWWYACDICQNVCPNNANAPINEEAVFMQKLNTDNFTDILKNLTPDSFEHYFKETVLYKFGYEGLKKRIR